MKTIKYTFAILTVSLFFTACAADPIEDEVGYDIEEILSEEDADEEVQTQGN